MSINKSVFITKLFRHCIFTIYNIADLAVFLNMNRELGITINGNFDAMEVSILVLTLEKHLYLPTSNTAQ